MSSFSALKEIAWKANTGLPQTGLVVHTFGNVSAIDRAQGAVAIKPSGIPYADLRVDDMVVVDLRNTILEGSLRPSSDVKTHLLLYRTFPAIGGIVHTHSRYATAWAQAMRPIPILGTTHADICPGDIPCTKVMTDAAIRRDYEEQTGQQILKTFRSHSYEETPMVLVACHGPFTWGRTAEEALYHAVMLEEIARTALLTLQVNPGTHRLKKTLVKKHFQRKHGPDAYYGQMHAVSKGESKR
jgi:L-ribulose-5-phosphate 4-epimerase